MVVLSDERKVPSWDDCCPVCGLAGDGRPYHICTNCGWERNLIQEEYPDDDGDANVMSLNEARQAYKEGREII